MSPPPLPTFGSSAVSLLSPLPPALQTSSGLMPITVLDVDADSPNASVLQCGDELISVAGESIRGDYDALMAQLKIHKATGMCCVLCVHAPSTWAQCY